MSMRRGRFLESLEETVKVNGVEIQENIIILEDRRPRLDPQGYITQELYYIGNIHPPNFDIRVNDQITREPRNATMERGSSNEQLQVLTVENISVIRGKQQLQLRDRDRVVR